MNKSIVLLGLLLSIGSGLCAQTSCDSLTIENIQYSAFNDSLLLVDVSNASSEIFSYPGFVLLDANSDTIAAETVNYFGIGTESAHILRIYPGVTLPAQGSVAAELHLWTGFYQNQACSWNLTFTPCPPAQCAFVELAMGNTGGAIVTDTLDWSITNSLGTVVASGAFEFGNMQDFQELICLPSESYVLDIESPLFTGGQLTYTLSDTVHWVNSLYANYTQGAPTNTISFDHYTSCPFLVNSVELIDQETFRIRQDGNLLHLTLINPSEAAILSVHNSQGKAIQKPQIITSQGLIDLSNIASGMLIITVTQGGKQRSMKHLFTR